MPLSGEGAALVVKNVVEKLQDIVVPVLLLRFQVSPE